MFSNGNFFIFFILLKYMVFVKILLAENSTNNFTYHKIFNNGTNHFYNITNDNSSDEISVNNSNIIGIAITSATSSYLLGTFLPYSTTSKPTVLSQSKSTEEKSIERMKNIPAIKVAGKSEPSSRAESNFENKNSSSYMAVKPFGNELGDDRSNKSSSKNKENFINGDNFNYFTSTNHHSSILRTVNKRNPFLREKPTNESLSYPESFLNNGKTLSINGENKESVSNSKTIRSLFQDEGGGRLGAPERLELPAIALPLSSSPSASVPTSLTGAESSQQPVFPERPDAVYFVVAVIGGAKTWARILARTLIDMGPPFGSSMGPPLRPIYVDLPANGRFSVKVLTSLCQQTDGIPLAGMVVIGEGQSARAVALSGNAMNIPVLWAKGGTANIYGLRRETQTKLQAFLEPSAKEILDALRALLLQTHWHTFFILSDVDATIVLSGTEGDVLRNPPLNPKIIPLPAGDGIFFEPLAYISRSTRGVVLMLCNLVTARRIMSEAKRLNMAGGHFIWLWADTSSTTEFFDLNFSQHEFYRSTPQHYPVNKENFHGDNNNENVDDIRNREGFATIDEFRNEKIIKYPEAVKQFTPVENLKETTNDRKTPSKLISSNKMSLPTPTMSTTIISSTSSIVNSKRGNNKKSVIGESLEEFKHSIEDLRSFHNKDILRLKDELSNEKEEILKRKLLEEQQHREHLQLQQQFKEKQRQQNQNEQKRRKQNTRISTPPYTKQRGSGDSVAGRYVFGLKDDFENSEDVENPYDDEIKAKSKEKRNNQQVPYYELDSYPSDTDHITRNSEEFEMRQHKRQRRQKPLFKGNIKDFRAKTGNSYKRNDNGDYVDVSDIGNDDDGDYSIPLEYPNNLSLNDYSDSSENSDDEDSYLRHTNGKDDSDGNSKDASNGKNHKPKRTSSYYSNNLTSSPHVMFHHFKDFPVGLLALRPIKMPIDRKFICSTIRLFAATWSKVEQIERLTRTSGIYSNNRRNDFDYYYDRQRRSRSLNREGDIFSVNSVNLNNKRNYYYDRNSFLQRRRRRIRRETILNLRKEQLHTLLSKENSNRNHYVNNNNSRISSNANDDKNKNSEKVNNINNNFNKIINEKNNNSNSSDFITNNNYKNINIISEKENSSDLNDNYLSSKISSYNQNLSGLINKEITSNDKVKSTAINNITKNTFKDTKMNLSSSILDSNIININNSNNRNDDKNESNIVKSNNSEIHIKSDNLIINRKVKRYNTWWSTSKGQEDAQNRSKNQQRPPLPSSSSSPTISYPSPWDGNRDPTWNALNEKHRKGAPYYRGGCFGTPSKIDIQKAEIFAKALKEAASLALGGEKIPNGNLEKPLTTNFELLNLVPDESVNVNSNTNTNNNNNNNYVNNNNNNNRNSENKSNNNKINNDVNSKQSKDNNNGNNYSVINIRKGRIYKYQQQQNQREHQQHQYHHHEKLEEELNRRRGPRKPANKVTKWRRVGIVSGTKVTLDTIVWPGGDIVVSGLSARARAVFRIVTALAPPFVMLSELDEDGLCLRGLPCHKLSPTAEHNLTLMFNAIETLDRLKEDAVEHGGDPPDDDSGTYDHSLYETKCCYGLSMDLLDNIATELGFEFHLYLVQDELFGTKYHDYSRYRGLWRTREDDTDRQTYWSMKQTTYNDPLTGQQINLSKRRRVERHYHSASFERKPNKNKENPSGEGNDENQEEDDIHYRHPSPPQTGIPSSFDDRTDDFNLPKNRWTDTDHFISGRTRFDNDRNIRTRNNNNDEDDDIDADSDDIIVEIDGDANGEDEGNEEIFDNYENYDSFSDKYHYRVRDQWNGIIGDLISGSADMSFAPLSVSRARAEVIDFSVPYFFSEMSWLAAPQSKSEIPLLAFLLPFSPELWIAIFTSLNVTAIAVAIYEWLSPFGLNPWGRQRSKNFSMSSALWVMWGLLCGHLVAFKAPKSWPNKFLINVWGGFSVIFIASYTANIAALIAGLFFHNASNEQNIVLLSQRVGAPTASAAEAYLKQNHEHLWEHMKKYSLNSIEDGIRGLKNGTLDLLLGDTPILDYYRATDSGCTLQKIGDSLTQDTYAIGMTKGFPLKDSISAIIAKYSSNGYLDILTEKWYGELPCFKLHNDIVQPRPLGVEAVAGVFLLLGLGVILGILILIVEHLFYKYSLPILRHKPKGSVWRSRNIMFFSQKLYRFINCVELVSPHHAARELVHTLRQGQIASLFQKSIKRKEDEQRRRRKSKAQFFEMIQEIRRVQQQEKANPKLEVVTEDDTSPQEEVITAEASPNLLKPRASPKSKIFSNRSRSNSSSLNVRRFSTDSLLSERLDTIGRRLSRDLTNSPPDFGKRFESFNKNISAGVSPNKKFDTFSGNLSIEKIDETKFDTYSGKDLDRSHIPIAKKHQSKRTPLNAEIFTNRGANEGGTSSGSRKGSSELTVTTILGGASGSGLDQRSRESMRSPQPTLPPLEETVSQPVSLDEESQVELRSQLHEELRARAHKKEASIITGDAPVRHHISAPSGTVTKKLLQQQQLKQQQQQQQQHQPYSSRPKSLDGLETRPPMPIPSPSRHSRDDLSTATVMISSKSSTDIKTRRDSNLGDNSVNKNDDVDNNDSGEDDDNDDEDDDDDDDDDFGLYSKVKKNPKKRQQHQAPALPLKVSPRSNLTQLSLDRLSREALLKLSESSQTEIHEYLSKPTADKCTEPP